MAKPKIIANIPTLNRKKLLLRCLDALKSQTYPLAGITILDNGCSDGTAQLLKSQGYIEESPSKDFNGDIWETEHSVKQDGMDNVITIHFIRNKENVGSGGGREQCMKADYESGADWFWIVDDDAVHEHDALERMMEKLDIIEENNIGFFSNKAFWKDGEVNLMNLPLIETYHHGVHFNKYEHKNTLAIQAATFVSFLVPREVVEKVGYPLRRFVVWGCDLEYADRIYRAGYVGFYMSDSHVTHYTKHNRDINIYEDDAATAKRYVEGVRAYLYVVRRRSLFKYVYNVLRNLTVVNVNILRRRKDAKWQFVWANTLGTVKSVV